MHHWPPTRLPPVPKWGWTTGSTNTSTHTYTHQWRKTKTLLLLRVTNGLWKRAEWVLSLSHTCQAHTWLQTHTYTDADTPSASPHDEVKLWPGQHKNAQQRGDRSVNHRGKHVLQSHCGALVSVSNRCQEALQWRGRRRGEMSWKSCRSHKTCAYVEAWHASEFLHLGWLRIATLHKLSSKSLITPFFSSLYRFLCQISSQRSLFCALILKQQIN